MAWQAISIIRVYNVFPWCYSIFEDLCQIRQVRQVQNLNCYNGYFTPHGTYKLKPPASTCQHLFLENTWQNFHVKSLEIIPVMSYKAWGSWWRVATSCTYIALYGAFVRVVDKTLTPQSLDYPYGLPTYTTEVYSLVLGNCLNQVSGQFSQHNDPGETRFTRFPHQL